jgi:hypothetical protein
MNPYKFGAREGDNWVPFAYPNVWQQEKTTGPDRLVIAPASGQIELLRKLLGILPEPFGILYVLLVPRGDVEPGRYQSPTPASRAEVDAVLTRFSDYLENDGRHHLWVMSLPAAATLVYDNHNVLYAYGLLEDFKAVLRQNGLHEDEVQIPSSHSHNYNVEYDRTENDMMALWEWRYFPLAEEEER